MWTSTTGGDYHGGYSTGPWIDAYRTSDGDIVHRTYRPDPSSFAVDIPGMWPEIAEDEWKRMMKWELDKEDKHKVSVSKKETYVEDERAVVCDEPKDLSIEHVLTTLSVVKGRLMMEVLPNHVKKLECSITPAVKQNIITASKKLKMYGKEMPIIPHFDEWGTRLPDEISIGDHSGITLKIVDPEDFGKFYYELKATVSPIDYSYFDPSDVPF